MGTSDNFYAESSYWTSTEDEFGGALYFMFQYGEGWGTSKGSLNPHSLRPELTSPATGQVQDGDTPEDDTSFRMDEGRRGAAFRTRIKPFAWRLISGRGGVLRAVILIIS